MLNVSQVLQDSPRMGDRHTTRITHECILHSTGHRQQRTPTCTGALHRPHRIPIIIHRFRITLRLTPTTHSCPLTQTPICLANLNHRPSNYYHSLFFNTRVLISVYTRITTAFILHFFLNHVLPLNFYWIDIHYLYRLYL